MFWSTKSLYKFYVRIGTMQAWQTNEPRHFSEAKCITCKLLCLKSCTMTGTIAR